MSPSFLNDPLVWLRKYTTRTTLRTSPTESLDADDRNRDHIRDMGCVQGKPFSPHRGLDRLKMESGYLPKGDPGDHSRRRSSVNSSGNHTHSTLPLFNSDPPPARNVHVNGRGGAEVEEAEEEEDGEVIDGWPKWLVDNVPRAVLDSLVPKSAENYEKIDKVGQGTYSNVYKAREKRTGKVVALKKVRFDTSEPESVKFMAREIMILQKLDHPNVIKLAGLATSRMQYSIYLVFDFMPADLSTVINRSDGKLTEPQVVLLLHTRLVNGYLTHPLQLS